MQSLAETIYKFSFAAFELESRKDWLAGCYWNTIMNRWYICVG